MKSCEIGRGIDFLAGGGFVGLVRFDVSSFLIQGSYSERVFDYHPFLFVICDSLRVFTHMRPLLHPLPEETFCKMEFCP